MGERTKATTKTAESKTEDSASQTTKTTFSPSISSSIDQILFLQRTVGNQAVQGLLKSGVIQAKLTIGKPGDLYEQEADRVAEQVMRMPDPGTTARKGLSDEHKGPNIQRMCTECEEELHRQPMEEEEEGLLQAKGVSGSTPEVTSSVESQINNVKGGGGEPLSESVRAFFEPRFGQDFSQVRVHTDSDAGESAKAVNAKAYTVGQDVLFNRGQYSPETESGKKLIAHELTHVVQQKNNQPLSFIQRDELSEGDEPLPQDKPARRGGFGITSPHQYQKSSTFRDKGKISILSTTNIIKVPEVVHERQTPKGKEKLPYEFILEHTRRVEVETVSGDRAVLIIKANKYLPFDKLDANPKISPKKAISMAGDFCNLRWSLDGAYGTKNFKEALYRKYGISGEWVDVHQKKIELFFATAIHRGEILGSKNARDPCSLKGMTEKSGPAFLYFNLSDRQQYQHIVDYLDGLLEERLKSEVEIRKKLEEEKKRRMKKEDRPEPKSKKQAPEAAAMDFLAAKGLIPDEKKGVSITLPGWLKGILKALGVVAIVLAVVLGVAALIALGVEALAGIAFAAAFAATLKVIGTLLLAYSFVSSLIKRFSESKLSGIGDFFKKLGVSILDILNLGEFIESFTDRSLITGKPLNLSEEERWERRTFGVLAIIAAAFGIRSWRKKGPGRGGAATTAEAIAQRRVESAFAELGGPKTGYKIQVCDDATVVETPSGGMYFAGRDALAQGGAVTHIPMKTIWVHESLVSRGGVIRSWGSNLNLKQVIAHELGHAQTGSFSCAVASRTGANLPGLTAAERQGLLDDAVNIEGK